MKSPLLLTPRSGTLANCIKFRVVLETQNHVLKSNSAKTNLRTETLQWKIEAMSNGNVDKQVVLQYYLQAAINEMHMGIYEPRQHNVPTEIQLICVASFQYLQPQPTALIWTQKVEAQFKL
jgi:hypothetical protein